MLPRIAILLLFAVLVGVVIRTSRSFVSPVHAEGEGAVAVSTFDTDDEGWTTTVDARCAPQPCYGAMDGNPGGYIYSEDDLQGIKFYFSAPSKFLGDASSAYQQHLVFDLRQSTRPDQNPTDDADVVLEGAGMQLVFNTPTNPPTFWFRYVVPLDESAGWHKGSLDGPRATADDFQNVLASLTALRIRGDYIFGQSVTSLDNVALGVANEPPSNLYEQMFPIISRSPD
jgi:alkaline phosphatase D